MRPIDELVKFSFAYRHFADGVSWEDSGAYEHMLRLIRERGRAVEGKRTLEDVVNKYVRVDGIFEQVRDEGRFRTREELRGTPARLYRICDALLGPAQRETTGVLVHIGRNGQPIFGGGSNNRMAIAIVLDLPVIPAHVGRVHKDALKDWRSQYRAGDPVP